MLPTTNQTQQSSRNYPITTIQSQAIQSQQSSRKALNQKLVDSSQLVPDAILETQRFNLTRRRRVAPSTGSSIPQLVTQSQYNSSRDWFFNSSTGHSLTSATTARSNTSATTDFPFPPAASYRLTDLSEVQKDLVYDASSIFSAFGEPVKTSCKKKEMKFEFRLLNDILAKSVTVKAGSFEAVTHERFLLMTAIHFGLKINWSKILFGILKEMVTKSSKQAKVVAAQICVLLQGAPNLTLGEANIFLPLKILTVKTIGTYIFKNKNITVDEDEPVGTVSKKAATKRRPAPAFVEPAAKKNRTIVGRSSLAEKNLAIVTVAQYVEPISMIPAVAPHAQRCRAPKRKLVLRDASDDEIVYNIIKQVITKTTEVEDVETDLEEPVVMRTAGVEHVEMENLKDVSSITNYDEDSNTEPLSKVLARTEKPTSDEESMPIDDILKRIPEEMMLPSYIAAEPTKITFGSVIEIGRGTVQALGSQPPIIKTWSWARVCIDIVQFHLFCHLLPMGSYNICTALVPVGPVLDRSAVPRRIVNNVQHRLQVESFCDLFVHHADPTFSLDSSSESILSISMSTPEAIPATPSSSRSSSSSDSRMHLTADDIPLDEETQIPMPTAIVTSHDYTDAFAQLRATVDQISFEKVQTRFHLGKLKVEFSKKISNLENAFFTASDNQDRVVLAQTNVLRKDMQAQKDALSKELDAMRKEVQDQKRLFRGRDDKNGEVSSSRGPQPPENRSRPGSGGGRRSDPSRKRGSRYRGRGSTSSRGFRYWLGE
ncbi:hypothetical protein F511_16718 [Dorcoceras hygrometricum]|uniref:Uncharacterized protein n=1 Tax=Dorcoceras hygrometricum TaxID=472368 RepID=A0A2Z7B817_9LAMI|nr:hypothetical protein F511_16718 [Dorcoceras hygrometricum]